jgi:hypothetical protein
VLIVGIMLTHKIPFVSKMPSCLMLMQVVYIVTTVL